MKSDKISTNYVQLNAHFYNQDKKATFCENRKMEHQNTNTIKCYCHDLRALADKTVHIKKRKKSSIYFIFISLTLFIILMCVTIYFICIVQNLSANYEQTLRKINDLQTDMFSLKQKYKQMESRLKASKEMVNALYHNMWCFIFYYIV